MSIKDIITNYFNDSENEYFILQGSLLGGPCKFMSPQKTNSGWDFNKNPLYSPFLKVDPAYVVMSRYYAENGELIKNIVNIQLFENFGDSYILGLGTGILLDSKLSFNMTLEEALLGEITFNLKDKNYELTRFVNAGSPFIDSGTFEQTSICEFSSTSGITLA